MASDGASELLTTRINEMSEEDNSENSDEKSEEDDKNIVSGLIRLKRPDE